MNGLAVRFWAKVRKTDTCWHWTAASFRRGYGAIKVNGKMKKAHRVSFEMHFGEIPDGQMVCHSCDTPSCVRPDHLFLGTSQENTADRDAKQRQCRGSRCHQSKLTREQVIEIRELYASGNYSQPELGRMYGVAHTSIGAIVRRASWKHV